jgi:hypothetical protein
MILRKKGVAGHFSLKITLVTLDTACVKIEKIKLKA